MVRIQQSGLDVVVIFWLSSVWYGSRQSQTLFLGEFVPTSNLIFHLRSPLNGDNVQVDKEKIYSRKLRQEKRNMKAGSPLFLELLIVNQCCISPIIQSMCIKRVTNRSL